MLSKFHEFIKVLSEILSDFLLFFHIFFGRASCFMLLSLLSKLPQNETRAYPMECLQYQVLNFSSIHSSVFGGFSIEKCRQGGKTCYLCYTKYASNQIFSYFLTHSRSNILRRISNFYSGSSTSVIERLVFPFLSFPRLYLLCKSPNISSSFFKLNFRLPAHFIQNSQVQLHHDPEAQSRKLIPTLKI